MTDAAAANPAKAPGLEINPVNDGYVVYQAARDRVHYLNQTAAIVFELCNGQNSPDDIAALLQQAWELTTPPATQVADCLSSLRQEGLIV